MENCIVNENNNDFLSQSYSQGIERITGTKDSTFNFQIPKKLLEIRKKTWDTLFNKYSMEMSDIELNVDTLEPEEEEEEEEEKRNSEGEYSCGQRVPMRKPATLVQYWINTGNPPYKVLLDENELSETGSSLSEKETILFHLTSPGINGANTVNAVNTVNVIDVIDKQKKSKNDSSCSSVDTAAYILSNANVTKKADTIAIIEGAKCTEIKSLKDSIKDTRVLANDKIDECMETRRIDQATHDDDDNVNVDVTDNELYSMSKTKYMVSEICDRPATNRTLQSADAIRSNIYSQSSSYEKTDKIDEFCINQRNLDVQTIDIVSIFRQFNKTSKRLVENDKSNNISDRDKILKRNTFHEKQVSENISEITAKDTNLTAFQNRKKLYTGRDSPVDIILTERHGTNRLSKARESLHPALDPDGTIKHALSAKRSFRSSKKVKRKEETERKKEKRKNRREPSCTSNKIITDISKYINDDKVQDSSIDSSFKSLLNFNDNSDGNRQDDIPFREYERDSANVSVTIEKCKQNLAPLNLNPIVLLERIKPCCFKRCKLKFDKNTHTVQKNVHNGRHLNKLKKLHSYGIENLEVESIDSDQSTILICQCNINASQGASSLSNCPLNLRSNIKDNSFASNIEKKDDKLSSSKDIDMSQSKELRTVEGLSQSLTNSYTNTTMESQISNKNNTIRQNVSSNKFETHSALSRKNKIDNVKLREIKVVLERLPSSIKNCTMTKTQLSNKNDTIWQKEIPNKSKAYFSNLYGANKKKTMEKDDGKFAEIRVVLERLPANVEDFKKISNVTNTNIFPNKKKISQITNLQINHQQELQVENSSKISCENKTAIRPVHNDYSLRMTTKSRKENNNEVSDIFDIVTESRNQIFDKTESDSKFQQKTFRHQNSNEASQDNCQSKYSVLTFTSDEDDDFVRAIQHPRKRSKVSKHDILGEPNITEKNFCDQTKRVINDKNQDRFSRNSNTIICSSERTVQRDIESMKEKRECSGVVEIKSFDSAQMTTDSLHIRKNERFVFFSTENDNDSADSANNSDKVKISFFDSKKNKINHDSKKHSNETVKKKINKTNCKEAHVMLFETKTYDTNSSESEESNSYTPSICKTLKSLPRNRLRNHNRADPEETFNDSIANRYSKRRSNLNSSLRHNRIHVRTRSRSRSVNKEAKANEPLIDEFNGDIMAIKSRINDIRKDASSSRPINVRNTQNMRKKMFSSTNDDLDYRSLSRNKKISDKSKDSLVILQDETYVTSTSVRKLLTFETKTYYDSSDSNETL